MALWTGEWFPSVWASIRLLSFSLFRALLLAAFVFVVPACHPPARWPGWSLSRPATPSAPRPQELSVT